MRACSFFLHADNACPVRMESEWICAYLGVDQGSVGGVLGELEMLHGGGCYKQRRQLRVVRGEGRGH